MFGKNSKNTKPSDPSGGNRNLNPMFGRYCCSQSFSIDQGDGYKTHMHYEITPADAQFKTWNVSLVHNFVSKGKPAGAQVFSKKKNCTFREALVAITQLEKSCLNDPKKYTPMFPGVSLMGYLHYKAFAEREGYIFDISGTPFARPHPQGLPMDVQFTATDIKTSSAHLKRPENEFDGMGPADKIPSTFFIFDQFNKAAHLQNMDVRINEVFALRTLDSFVEDIQKAQDAMKEYCAEYKTTGKKYLIDKAERFLNHALNLAKQLEHAHIDPAPFQEFALQSKVYCHALHAECLFKLIQEDKVEFDIHKEAFNQSVKKAVETFKRLNPKPAEIELLKKMIVQRDKPVVSDAIQVFLDNYKKQKNALENKGSSNTSGKNTPSAP